MTQARHRQLCLELTPYYHCTSRCVRQAYLCGNEKHSKKKYGHRRRWIEDRLLFLSRHFCIEVAGFAVMSNHFHVVLKVDQDKAKKLSDNEVLERWLKLYKGTQLAQRYQSGEALEDIEREALSESISRWRSELSNLSRFMGNLNEYIARKANKEDDCTGRFWQGRFSLQAILDQAALLATLCYVDLNPVRAKVAKTPEQSKYTSIYRRLRHTSPGLVAFQSKLQSQSNTQSFRDSFIPIKFSEYLILLDWTGRQHKKGRRGVIRSTTPDIIARLGYTPGQWRKLVNPQVNWKQRALGSVNKLRTYCDQMEQRWIWGVSSANST